MEQIKINPDKLNNTNIKATDTNNKYEKHLKLFEELNEHKFFGIIITKAMNILSEKLKNKIIEIIKAINTNKIYYDDLKKLVFEGLPDDISSLRSLVWKLLLNYLPLNVNDWEEEVDKKRTGYATLKKKYFTKLEFAKIKKNSVSKNQNECNIEVLDEIKPFLNTNNNNNNLNIDFKNPTTNENKKPPVIKKRNTSDHPLAMSDNSKWKNYFDDLDLLEEIEKDVRRTRTHMHFFFMPSKTNTQIISTEKIVEMADKKRNEPGSNLDKILHKNNNFESNADVMCKILFVYGKKYPEIRYVQGMNELLAPIFYCFSNDLNPYFYTNLEADCYICFENLMHEIRDIFNRSKDNTETGIQTRLKNLNSMLKIIDKEIYDHLNDYNVEIQYFAFRWYTLFLTQEFDMPDILRLWDSILAEDDKFEFLNMTCLAIIKLKRNEIMQSDFSGIMLSLQNLDKLDIEKIINTADGIRLELNKNNIYY